MATAAQITANQMNAQLSTGPRTAEGKARVSQNALRHGLTSKHLVVRDGEQGEFDELEGALLAELDPQGATETIIFRELLHAAWNLHRFRRIEVESSIGTAADFSDPATAAVLDRLGRYQARSQRAYYKALQELRKLQTNRALRAVKLDEEEEAAVPAIAEINDLTKQTRSEVTAKALNLAVAMVDYEVKTLQANSISKRADVPRTRPTPTEAALRL